MNGSIFDDFDTQRKSSRKAKVRYNRGQVRRGVRGVKQVGKGIIGELKKASMRPVRETEAQELRRLRQQIKLEKKRKELAKLRADKNKSNSKITPSPSLSNMFGFN